MKRLAPRADAWHAALLVTSLAVLLRLALAAIVPPVADEAYYWDWSRHLAGGYFDHPPMVALLIRAGVAIAGVTPLGLRLGAVLAGWGASLAVMVLARRLGGDRAALWSAVILACMPLSAIGLVLASPDVPVLLFGALTLLATDRAIRAAPPGRAALACWAAGGVALGCAFDSKYTAVLIPLGVLIALATHPPLRRQLATPGPYLAVVLALLVFAPVIRWNAHHDWASFRFQLGHGFGGPRGVRLSREGDLIGGQLALVSPILFVMMAIAVARALQLAADPPRLLLGTIPLTVLAFFMTSALRRPTEANWPAPAYLAAIPLLASLEGGRRWRTWLAAGCALGALLSLAVYAQAVRPWLPIAATDDPTARGEGWSALAARVQAVRDDVSPDATTWVAGQRYQEAAELAFHLRDHPEVFAIDVGDRPNEYRFWPRFRDRAHRDDALVLAAGVDDSTRPPPVITTLGPHFERVTSREIVTLARGSEVLTRRRIWLLEGWRGTWPPDSVMYTQ